MKKKMNFEMFANLAIDLMDQFDLDIDSAMVYAMQALIDDGYEPIDPFTDPTLLAAMLTF